MPSSTNDLDKNNTQNEPKTTSPTHSNRSQSSSPSCSAILVIDDTSDADEPIETKQLTNTSTKQHASSNPPQISHVHIPTPTRRDSINNVIHQQRRRNSSIAKLLGGQPLHNQQYEEINQQILDHQSAQNINNNHDNGTDSIIQRTRSSITRTLLMNSDRTNSRTKLPASGILCAKDFEYLIHGELDNEHGQSINPKTNSVSKSSSTSSNSITQSSNQMKLKRKRQFSKSSSNMPPFALHDPFELQTSSNESIPSINSSQKKYVHFESSKRPCYSSNSQSQHSYHSSMDNSSTSTTNHSTYSCPPVQRPSSPYNQFSIHDDRRSSCNCAHISNSRESELLSSPTTPITSTRKAKSMVCQSDIQERPRPRSYSNITESSSSSTTTTIPLKKRLLDAYNNTKEQ